MTITLIKKLDDFFEKNNYQSMDWCDGIASHLAEGIIAKFNERDWSVLSEIWSTRSIQWQLCLVSILDTQYGNVAQDIFIQMAGSDNPEVVFEAMYSFSFYCDQ